MTLPTLLTPDNASAETEQSSQATAPLDGRYRLRRPIGQGGTAQVWEAEDLVLERPVAVKLLHPDRSAERRLQHELAALGPLSHPGIVRLYDAGIDPTAAYLVMEYVEGKSLAEHISAGPMPPEEVRELGGQLAQALAHAHRVGLAHLDVKPANVLIDSAGQPRLTDFGIASPTVSDRQTETAPSWATPAYAAPEQLAGQPVSSACDVYGLGMVLLDCLKGRGEDEPLRSTLERCDRGPVVPTDLGAPWRELLTAMTDPRPERRPSAEHVAALLQSRPQRCQPRHASARGVQWKRRRRAVARVWRRRASAGSLVLAGLLAGVVGHWTGSVRAAAQPPPRVVATEVSAEHQVVGEDNLDSEATAVEEAAQTEPLVEVEESDESAAVDATAAPAAPAAPEPTNTTADTAHTQTEQSAQTEEDAGTVGTNESAQTEDTGTGGADNSAPPWTPAGGGEPGSPSDDTHPRERKGPRGG